MLRESSSECYQVDTCNAKTMLERKSKDQRGKTEKEKEIPIKYHRPLAAYRSHTISGRGGAPRSRAEAFSNSSKVQHCCTTAKNPTKLEVWTREERTGQCLTTWLHTACLSVGYIWCEADCRAYLFTGQLWGRCAVASCLLRRFCHIWLMRWLICKHELYHVCVPTQSM